MGREVFQNAGIGVFESLSAWLRPQRFRRKVTISGLHHLVEAQQQDRSILLLGAHYTMLDLGGLLGSWFFKVDTVYRPQNNPLLEWIITRLRAPIYQQQIDHDDMRKLVRALKDKHVVWYTPDQDFGLKQGVMADFFGVDCLTSTLVSKLAQKTGCTVIGLSCLRRDDLAGFDVYCDLFDPQVADRDLSVAVTVLNHNMQQMIVRAPEQYLWSYRRFKVATDLEGLYRWDEAKVRQVAQDRVLDQSADQAQ